MGGDAGARRRRAAPAPGGLSEEQRRKLLFAVTSLESRLGGAAYPSSEVLSHLLRHCAAEHDREVRRRCLRLLQKVAFLHPPHGRQLRELYRAALAGPEGDWKPLRATVERCLRGRPADSARPRGGDCGVPSEQHLLDTELLDLMVSLMEEDMTFWWRTSRR